jgi:hypothetical protein
LKFGLTAISEEYTNPGTVIVKTGHTIGIKSE